MAGTGPPPSPTSRKQTGSHAHTWTSLPPAGFGGPIPDWPLISPTEREVELWSTLWRTPQAAAWSSLGWTLDAALYVRVLVEAELGDMKAITEARLRSLDLGLTPTGMLKNRWRIHAVDEVAERREEKSPTMRRRTLKVAPDAVAGS